MWLTCLTRMALSCFFKLSHRYQSCKYGNFFFPQACNIGWEMNENVKKNPGSQRSTPGVNRVYSGIQDCHSDKPTNKSTNKQTSVFHFNSVLEIKVIDGRQHKKLDFSNCSTTYCFEASILIPTSTEDKFPSFSLNKLLPARKGCLQCFPPTITTHVFPRNLTAS